MTKYSNALLLLTLTILVGCTTTQSVSEKNQEKAPFVWEAASVYFLMTDRFYNGDKSNDTNFNRTKTTGKLRGFEGGILKESQKKLTKAILTN
jgi:alpha-amylase